MKIHKELNEISKDLQKMARRIEQLTASIPEKMARSPKASMPKSASAKKVKKTGTQTVLDIISRSRKGIDALTLIKKTGFQDKKVRNILFNSLKEGKIERVGRAVYKASK